MNRLLNWLNPPKPEPEKMLVRLHFAKENESLEGILLGETEGHYRLVSAKVLINPEAKPTPVGEVLVRKEKVFFLQVLERATAL